MKSLKCAQCETCNTIANKCFVCYFVGVSGFPIRRKGQSAACSPATSACGLAPGSAWTYLGSPMATITKTNNFVAELVSCVRRPTGVGPICHVGLDSYHSIATEHTGSLLCLRFGNLSLVLLQRVSTIAIRIRNRDIWMHLDAYRCMWVLDGCIRPTYAYMRLHKGA